MAKQYPVSEYDSHFSLKVNLSTWGALLFLARPFVILLISIANRRDKMGLMNFFYHDPIAMTIDIFAALPALLVIFAWVRRLPAASDPIRWIWSHGRSLLLLATLINIASVFLPLAWNPNVRMQIPELSKLAICVAILFMLVKSKRIKDTFDDFPPPVKKKKTS